MEEIRSRISAFSGPVTFQNLKEFIKSLDPEDIPYREHIMDPAHEGDYGRNILTLEPFECVLIHWPPQVESAVHHHQGLFGYVWVLEGELDNIFYRKTDGRLEEFTIDRYGKDGLIPEPDGVIHKLRNNSEVNRAITLHFYYPALETFDGMEIFRLETGELGILSDQAETASWLNEPGHFKEVKKDAFTYVSFDELNKNKSHYISYVIPKPDPDRICDMNGAYFCEQANQYDFSDFNQPNRRSYIDFIDQLVADGIRSQEKVEKHLDIATGTGRRALNIRDLSQRDYEITGVDISESMCQIASERGLKTFHQDWANEEGTTGETYDVITFLYAFGHIPSERSRIRTLRKIADSLTPDGTFYVDTFSLKNVNEWGPLVDKAFRAKQLGELGYQLGDVFYRKRGLKELAFLHYFTLDELERLFTEAGLKIVKTQYVGYARNPGQLVGSENEGNIFITAKNA